MSTDLEPQVTIVSPVTGEVLSLASPTVDLARLLYDVRDLESRLREAKREVSRELSARLDKQACWTLHLEGGFKVTGQSPQPAEEWNGPELREALLALVDEGVLAVEAVDAAVETIVTYKPRKAGITALRKLGGRVAETVDGLCVTSERERRISVTRA